MTLLHELPRPIDRNSFVFQNAVGGRNQNLHHAWRKAVTAAGVEDFRFHDLRHTFASRLVSSGVDLAVLRELMGHKDIQMTLRYAHLSPSRMTEAVALLDSTGKTTVNHGHKGAAG